MSHVDTFRIPRSYALYMVRRFDATVLARIRIDGDCICHRRFFINVHNDVGIMLHCEDYMALMYMDFVVHIKSEITESKNVF